MVQISEVKGNNRDNRTAAHTHIKGLGLNNGIAEKQAAGFVGQTGAREVGSFNFPGSCGRDTRGASNSSSRASE